MPPHLVIDGYNYLHRTAADLFDRADLEGARAYFLERLAEYKRGRKMRITVVFDATRGDSFSRFSEHYKGIEIIYSRRGETADEVILEAIRGRQAGLIVVSSDRAIIDEAKSHAITFVTPPKLALALDGAPEEDDEMRMEKKGNANRLPKQVRRARRTIRKI